MGVGDKCCKASHLLFYSNFKANAHFKGHKATSTLHTQKMYNEIYPKSNRFEHNIKNMIEEKT